MGPGQNLFCLVSFEGPDQYAQVGDLSLRVSGLAHGLAALGYETHLFFLGDPRLPGSQRVLGGHLTLHRWGQWLSGTCPGGVYQAEEARLHDLAETLPDYLMTDLIRPMIRARFTPVVLAMEWQTLAFLRAVDGRLRSEGLRAQATLAWELAAESLGRFDWNRVPGDLRLLSRDPGVAQVAGSAGALMRVIPDGADGILRALTGSGDGETTGSQKAPWPGPSRQSRLERILGIRSGVRSRPERPASTAQP
jgi:hypothetical protein